jgi:hypothetical protein
VVTIFVVLTTLATFMITIMVGAISKFAISVIISATLRRLNSTLCRVCDSV